ncbi:MAG TPA: hypothetical protein VE988_22475 [Gemmataceae bacterium]|nr:hypothetical protein [Gemmataceae bacterium]
MVNPIQYSPALAELLAPELLPPLEPGAPNTSAYAKLKALRIDTAFAPHAIADHDMAACCLSGLWLLHSYLDESHKISQEIETTSGSYWHGLMHRREGDFSNSKYWFRRVGKHSVFTPLQQEVARLAAGAKICEAGFLTSQSEWDPFAFVDLCERSLNTQSAAEALCVRIQRCEWDLLFAHCHAHAVVGQRND